MKIDRNKSHNFPLIPIEQAARDANCTVSDLLQLAENGEVHLNMALRGFSATSANTMGEKHPYFPARTAPRGEDVYLSPAYARELHRFGRATVTHIVAENMPAVDGDDLWFWKLEQPQDITIDQVFVCSGHVSADDDQKSDPKNKLPDLKSSKSSMSCSADWEIVEPAKTDALATMIYNALNAIRREGRTKPKAASVVEYFEATKPKDFVGANDGGVEWYNADGTASMHTSNAEIQRRINRMTGKTAKK